MYRRMIILGGLTFVLGGTHSAFFLDHSTLLHQSGDNASYRVKTSKFIHVRFYYPHTRRRFQQTLVSTP
ncbi:hypothetical protein BDV40DRAFT_40640 [Aspergillus tamarii]|uniref:Uncharacterized protein n=1 Tax=Aspergillus tamarii TaxID=41984 RepID=A0A5N6V4M9_ASPTM|nr:hypothetical protein BDV40DRAFT_40640 [Aspergillus tamarii]